MLCKMSLNYTEIADINDIINDEISFWAYPLHNQTIQEHARSLSFAMPQISLWNSMEKAVFPKFNIWIAKTEPFRGW